MNKLTDYKKCILIFLYGIMILMVIDLAFRFYLFALVSPKLSFYDIILAGVYLLFIIYLLVKFIKFKKYLFGKKVKKKK